MSPVCSSFLLAVLNCPLIVLLELNSGRIWLGDVELQVGSVVCRPVETT